MSSPTWKAPSPRLAEAAADWWAVLRPPPRLTVSEWADRYRQLSSEDSAEQGQWDTSRAEYQRGIMDAVTDPAVREVVFLASAQVGKTAILFNIAGYFISQDPSPIMWVTTTLTEAEAFSRDRFEPFRRDNPQVAAQIGDPRSRASDNTILDKRFPGGRLLFRGANSPAGLRSHPIRVLIMDEIDGYPTSTTEGEPTKLAQKRTTAFWNRKIIKASTPAAVETSRIIPAYEASDRRKFWVPCPHCGHRQTLEWESVHFDKTGGGDILPETARYACCECGAAWSDIERWDAVRGGEWVAEAPFNGVAGFYINELYSPFVKLEDTVRAFKDAKGDPEALRTFYNTALGRGWRESISAPDWEMLYRRRRRYEMGKCPKGVLFLTAGCDVQKDRIEVEIVGWGRGKRSWSIDYKVIQGDVTTAEPWLELDRLLEMEWLRETGDKLPIQVMAVDSGAFTTNVYEYVRRHPQPSFGPAGVVVRSARTVIATKGASNYVPRIISSVSKDDATNRKRGIKVIEVGTQEAKSELHRWLRLPWPSDEEIAAGAELPPGACQHPEYNEGYFRQLCAEEIVIERRNGVAKPKWQLKKGERNEALDARVYARAAAEIYGISRFAERHWLGFERLRDGTNAPPSPPTPPAGSAPEPAPPTLAPAVNPVTGRQRGGFFGPRRR